jgi:polar amino acid transport system substrate-binding protein
MHRYDSALIRVERRRIVRLAVALATLAPARGVRAVTPTSPSSLVVAFVADFEPFVMGRDGGILVELVREAARRLGYGVRKLDFPSLRLDQDPLDAFTSLDMFAGTPATRRPHYHYTPLYAFDNVAASLTERGLKIDSVQDLRGKFVVAFHNAALHLKEPFTSFHRQVLANSKSYLETERMASIVAMLLNGRAQVVLLDRTFLRYYARQQGRPGLQGITLHELFPERNIIYLVGKDQPLIARMQRQLQQMEQTGWTAGMLKNYL